jgi:RNA polymerase sigma-70 factor, ECF subfamily
VHGDTVSGERAAVDDVADAYRQYFGLIRAKCRRMLSDAQEAEDVAQETFIRLWRDGPPGSADAAQVGAWVYRTSTRLAIDRLRQRRRWEPEVVDAPDCDAGPIGEDLAARVQARQQVERFARVLTEQELEVALLHRVDGLTQPEVAQVIGVSERTVRRLLARLDVRLGALRAEAHR